MIDIEKIPEDLKMCTLSILKIALTLKNTENDKKKYMEFCDEAWESMLLNDPDELNEAIDQMFILKIKESMEHYKNEN